MKASEPPGMGEPTRASSPLSLLNFVIAMKHAPLVFVLLASLAAPAFAQDADEALSAAVAQAVEEVAPCVLRVETFGGLEKVDGVLVGRVSTATAVHEDGYAIASAYSFVHKPPSIFVITPAGKRVAADIVARDHARMVVLLKAHTDEKFAVPQPLARSELTVGQSAVAVGRTFDKDAPNISVGILSATNRIWGKAVQTDAKISPANYGGPLIDLTGRVMGVLVPMSPQGSGEVAGAEWYDSGIGFAVPLTDVLARLDTLKSGRDLHPGRVGVSLGTKGDYTPPVEIAAVLPGSPAAKVGLAKGDRVVEVAGKKVRWLAHMKHALGPKYAGDLVRIAVLRDDVRIERDLELAADIPPYDVPFLGILPRRDYDGPGVQVRFVYPGSGADEAGIKADDVILAVDDSPVANANKLRDAVGTHDREAADVVSLKVQREGKSLTLNAKLASLPTEIPKQLPPAQGGEAREPEGEAPAETGLVEIQLAEERNKCQALVPQTYRPAVPHGLVVRLHAPGKADRAVLPELWEDLCERHNLIVLAPQSAKEKAWEATEAKFVHKAIEEVSKRYNIDPARIVVHGHQAGGTFGALVAFTSDGVVRGVSLIDSPLPGRVTVPASDPIDRVAYFVAVGEKSPDAQRIQASLERLQKMKLPVTERSLGEKWRNLSEDELSEFARWVDSLDRI